MNVEKLFSIIVVADGAKLRFKRRRKTRNKEEGVTKELARHLEKMTGFETRVTILGHVQRGGAPTAYDRILATRFGTFAFDSLLKKKFSHMVALHGNRMVAVSLKEAVRHVKKCDLSLYTIAERFFG